MAIFLCGLSTGCITDAMVDLTKAKFTASTDLTDATTGSIPKLTDGTSQATTDLTEPTREFLSSTTPGAWFQANGTLNPDYKKIAFVVLNFDNLQEDIAHGGGEYLVSLSTLMKVPPHSREEFFTFAQGQYGYIFVEGAIRSGSAETSDADITRAVGLVVRESRAHEAWPIRQSPPDDETQDAFNPVSEDVGVYSSNSSTKHQ